MPSDRFPGLAADERQGEAEPEDRPTAGELPPWLEGDEVPPGTPLGLAEHAVWDAWDWWLVRDMAAMRDPNTPAHRHGWRVTRREDVAICRCGTVRVGPADTPAQCRYHLVWRGA